MRDPHFVGFNTQPPEGGCFCQGQASGWLRVSTHSHPKVADDCILLRIALRKFQHTATRRWLVLTVTDNISTNSFNTQPPEGGCWLLEYFAPLTHCFNTQPPEGGCYVLDDSRVKDLSFNTQPPEGG